ncbi:helix-turn-helix domain-containing protein [Chryseobacterium jejuense]|uniref:DNA-binding transcriptional regulator MelR n=1 Tax=Chryseobacterium jejuense TaxID=445960 RepID=A0A2X2X8V7_CHRJE|nr:helix-turn-helix domain-containing protein [Chryseobacterium jejuense]SDI57961.1 Helix-turn-helix domain-containing protein [Chryseobacterium jejuense]SQB47101.1 DNA-binding transcriptional regulator MelR [Chryseobacterium jejuense]
MADFDLGILYWAGIFIACFSSLLILGKQKKKTQDFLLAIWFLIIGVHLVFFILLRSEGYLKYPYLLGYEILLPFIHGPMLYLYILYITGRNPGKKDWLLNWVPVLIIYLILFRFLMLSPQDRMMVYQNKGRGYEVLSDVIKVLMNLSGVLYVSLSLFAIKKYKQKISSQYSNTEKINLNWSYYLITGIALIWMAVIIRNDILIFSMVVLFILVAAYFGISRVGILDLPVAEKVDEKAVGNEFVKYQKNFPGDNAIQTVYEKLIARMAQEKLYKDPDLNLNYVAQLLDVHPNILSQVINSVENKNFYDYINRQRVEEFKRIASLPENHKYTILSLAFESGFNSKTSFNRNFKKYMNCSPREFLKSKNLTLES